MIMFALQVVFVVVKDFYVTIFPETTRCSMFVLLKDAKLACSSAFSRMNATLGMPLWCKIVVLLLSTHTGI
jgi:hypothetical protein